MKEQCPNCPNPNNPSLESYQFLNRRWDVAQARQIIERDGNIAQMIPRTFFEKIGLAIEPLDWEKGFNPLDYHANDEHLAHIPADKILEPVIFAPMYVGDMKTDTQVHHVMIDGTHRATVLFRGGSSDVAAFVLTVEQSKECCTMGWVQPRGAAKPRQNKAVKS